jgi:hypothetical protein
MKIRYIKQILLIVFVIFFDGCALFFPSAQQPTAEEDHKNTCDFLMFTYLISINKNGNNDSDGMLLAYTLNCIIQPEKDKLKYKSDLNPFTN